MIGVERFSEVCRSLPYRDKGMFYSEVFFFLQACADHGIDMIVESGVKNGMSTRLIASAWPGEIISIDKDSGALEPVEGVQFLHGDSRRLIPLVLEQSAGRKVAVLIDGPKGAAALALKDAIWAKPEVLLVAIHDLPLGSAPDASRHSQTPEYRVRTGLKLDAIMKHHYRDKYPGGPGLAIWEKPL